MNIRIEKIICLFGCLCYWMNFTNSTNLKIVGGRRIRISSRPYMVSIHEKNGELICGGTVLSPRWVLTALHCFTDSDDLKNYYLRAGTSFSNRAGSVRSIRKLVIYNDTMHEDIPFLPIHDIILIRLNPKYLRTVRVNKVNIDKCIEKMPLYNGIINNISHLCYGQRNRDSCNGDSGGPLTNKLKIHGIVSFGIKCGVNPGVYVKVSHYIKWILQTILPKKGNSQKKP
ncbi:trypsin-4-like [Aphidius gifuensis]|uniref:trypsin-4-like n=1 Tax=Aphidius gifuensis TaxID=684658 RepID=UPI001CDB790F|nr:trypsin-4-like [Aphidius gifuensis]